MTAHQQISIPLAASPKLIWSNSLSGPKPSSLYPSSKNLSLLYLLRVWLIISCCFRFPNTCRTRAHYWRLRPIRWSGHGLYLCWALDSWPVRWILFLVAVTQIWPYTWIGFAKRRKQDLSLPSRNYSMYGVRSAHHVTLLPRSNNSIRIGLQIGIKCG